jgi:hypothetical protein
MGDDVKAGIHPDALEPGHVYRVDHKHERLRRSFRTEGTFIGKEQRPPEEGGGEPVTVLVFEVKPRFGKPGRQVIAVSTIQTIVEP